MQTLRALRSAISSAFAPLARFSVLGGLLGGLVASCGGGGAGGFCTDLYAYGLNVTVSDGSTFQPVCDATVTAVDGEYSETLMKLPSNGSSSCTYVGAGERAGTYTVTASKSGFMNATQSNVKVVSDGCHVAGVAVKLTLTM